MIFKNNKFYAKHHKIINYIFWAVITSVLHVGVFWLMDLICDSLILSNIVAYVFSILFSFFINKSAVFADKNTDFMKQLIKYVLVKSSSFIIDTIILFILSEWLLWPTLLAKLIANCSTTINNYILSKKIVFCK